MAKPLLSTAPLPQLIPPLLRLPLDLLLPLTRRPLSLLDPLSRLPANLLHHLASLVSVLPRLLLPHLLVIQQRRLARLTVVVCRLLALTHVIRALLLLLLVVRAEEVGDELEEVGRDAEFGAEDCFDEGDEAGGVGVLVVVGGGLAVFVWKERIALVRVSRRLTE